MNKIEKIVLCIYFLLLTINYFVAIVKVQISEELNLFLFFTLFLPAFSIHTCPLANSLRKGIFSIIWLIISTLLLIIPYVFTEFKILFHNNSVIFMLPFVGFIYYHIIRLIYIIILNREPMTVWIKYVRHEYSKELSRTSDGFDLIFTLISFFGFIGIMLTLFNI